MGLCIMVPIVTGRFIHYGSHGYRWVYILWFTMGIGGFIHYGSPWLQVGLYIMVSHGYIMVPHEFIHLI